MDYTITETDTLERVAVAHDSTVGELMKLNKMASRMLFPGQKILVPLANSEQKLQSVSVYKEISGLTGDKDEKKRDIFDPDHLRTPKDSPTKIQIDPSEIDIPKNEDVKFEAGSVDSNHSPKFGSETALPAISKETKDSSMEESKGNTQENSRNRSATHGDEEVQGFRFSPNAARRSFGKLGRTLSARAKSIQGTVTSGAEKVVGAAVQLANKVTKSATDHIDGTEDGIRKGPEGAVPAHVRRGSFSKAQSAPIPCGSNEEADTDCLQKLLKIKVKQVTESDGTVSGTLLVTPNCLMFDPDVSHPLVKENGPDLYGMVAKLENIMFVSIHEVENEDRKKETTSIDSEESRTWTEDVFPEYSENPDPPPRKNTEWKLYSIPEECISGKDEENETEDKTASGKSSSDEDVEVRVVTATGNWRIDVGKIDKEKLINGIRLILNFDSKSAYDMNGEHLLLHPSACHLDVLKMLNAAVTGTLGFEWSRIYKNEEGDSAEDLVKNLKAHSENDIFIVLKLSSDEYLIVSIKKATEHNLYDFEKKEALITYSFVQSGKTPLISMAKKQGYIQTCLDSITIGAYDDDQNLHLSGDVRRGRIEQYGEVTEDVMFKSVAIFTVV
ncbi:hypothetical protein CAEBREN_07109 [Caenorhabditis brenneri]|uniref:LysM domain-containing protein n=1 Tax=Caenorhabditis brenneri TaxID=135651 RepID=G0NE53_CAEBE|nr:hypothetical protein CAEBREN_07109 [Caenorhabditis brenneri]